MVNQVQEKIFKVNVDFVTGEFVKRIDEVAKENCMDIDHFIRYVLRQWLNDNCKRKKIFVDAKTYRLLEANALQEGKTISRFIEHLIAPKK